MTEKALTGRGAWTRLFAELTCAIRVELAGRRRAACALDVALSRLVSPDRERAPHDGRGGHRRARARPAHARLRLQHAAADKAVDDRLRRYPNWLASRNLANEACDESVQALVEAVRARYELPRRWYRLKAELLGLDRLADYDRMAVGRPTRRPRSAGPRPATSCSTSFHEFSPELGDLAQRFFDERWIDAPVRPNKRGGAFCAYTVPCVHPYVMLNYTSRRRDVLTLAHELGHGVHAALARRAGRFSSTRR